MRGITAEGVDRAREKDRSLLRAWVMRGTLHLLATEDADWMLPLYAERELRWSRRRIQNLIGLDETAQRRASAQVVRLLTSRGETSRQEVAANLREAGFSTESNAIHHLARLPVLEGSALLGPDRRGKTSYVLRRDWIGDPGPFDHDTAMSELARRHLGAFGPADERDMAAWSGLGLRECRAAMERIGRELDEVEVGGQRAWILAKRPPRAARSPQVRLLPAFDNHLMGHGSRDIAVPAMYVKRVWPGAGIVRATVLADGIAVGTWGARRGGGEIKVTLDLFARSSDAVLRAVEAEVADVGLFEGSRAAMKS